MPIEHRYDAEQRVLHVRAHGAVTDAELLEYARVVTTDPALDPDANEVIDLRDVTAPDATTETLKRVADTFRDAERAAKPVRIALVAAGDAAYGLARMYQAFRIDSPAEIQVFREMGKARDWLGLAPE